MFLYYCSLQDVKDWLYDLDFVADDANTPYTDQRIRRAISRSYGEINAALKSGGYAVPVENDTTTTTSNDITGDPDYFVSFAVDDESGFSAGDTVRIHGSDGSVYQDEFTGLVAVSTGSLTAEVLQTTYALSGATVELCTEGYLYIRECNAIGGAVKLLFGKVVGQAKSRNEKVITLLDEYNARLELIRNGEVELDGVTVSSSEVLIETYQTENPEASTEANPGALVSMTMDF